MRILTATDGTTVFTWLSERWPIVGRPRITYDAREVWAVPGPESRALRQMPTYKSVFGNRIDPNHNSQNPRVNWVSA